MTMSILNLFLCKRPMNEQQNVKLKIRMVDIKISGKRPSNHYCLFFEMIKIHTQILEKVRYKSPIMKYDALTGDKKIVFKSDSFKCLLNYISQMISCGVFISHLKLAQISKLAMDTSGRKKKKRMPPFLGSTLIQVLGMKIWL